MKKLKKLFMLFVTIAPFSVMAAPVPTSDLSGKINGFTYTDSSGTFTTSDLLLSLNQDFQSFFDENTIDGTFKESLFADVTFDDGKGNNIKGLLTLETAGTFAVGGSSEDALFENIISGTLSNVGEFSGTTITGLFGLKHFSNCDGGGFQWCKTFSVDPSPDPTVFINLDPTIYSGETTFAISGIIATAMVPEPNTFVLLFSGAIGLVFFRRKQ